MSANLLTWLLPFRFRTGPISPRRSDAKLSALITSLIGVPGATGSANVNTAAWGRP